MSSPFIQTESRHLDEISTRWPSIGDPCQFTLRYAGAIRGYLQVLLSDPEDVEEVLQSFLLHVVERGFTNLNLETGRFRDYLKAMVRNAAMTYLRQRRSHPRLPEEVAAPADADWIKTWRQCLIDAAWRALFDHESQTDDNYAYTTLHLTTTEPKKDSRELAALASQQTGHAFTPTSYRKQVSRARRLFAKLLIEQVAASLDDSSREAVQEELSELGLLSYIRRLLP